MSSDIPKKPPAESKDALEEDPSRLDEVEEHDGLNRSLASRHLMMMAIGGVIGPGYFVGMGTGLSTAGPAGLLICFGVIGGLLWTVMQSLGELGAFPPTSGSFTHYTSRFLDPALGFALGWNYFFLWAGIIMAEYNNLGLILTFWDTAMPRWGWILVFWFIFLSSTFLGVWAFGEAEFWLTTIKILAIASFFLCAILISAGVIGDATHKGHPIGFKYYSSPGAFADGAKGVFEIFVFAALQYSGTEMVGLTAGESRNPSRDIPRAVRSVLWRIVVIFLGGIFFLTITVPFDDPSLLNGSSKSAKSPFVIAFLRVGVGAGAHAFNAIILVTIFSAINSALYVGSRTLYGLAQEGAAPSIFLRTTKKGAPLVALVTINLLGFLSLLNLSSGAGVLYKWIVTMTGVATFITWSLITLCHIRLRLALQAQNISTAILPYRAVGWPYGAYIGFRGSVFFVFFQGWTAFAPWSVSAFMMNYVMIAVFVLFAVGWKVWKGTRWVGLKEVDLGGQRTDIDVAQD